MRIIISKSTKEPIYKQIYQQIKQQILKGELKGGQDLPSMRELAKDLQVSVITTKHAYVELEKHDLIYSIVGKGSFVVEQPLELVKEHKLNAIEEKLDEAVKNGKEIGLSLSELQEMLSVLYRCRNNLDK